VTLDINVVLFITINGVFHCQHNLIIGVNLLYYYDNMFQPNMAIFRPTKL